MSDMLRVARLDPVFLDAVELWLVERSPPLQRRQARQLAGWAIHWAKDLAEVPSGAPAIIIANEFLDCLPARQFIRIDGTWRERVVAAVDGRLVFGVTSCLQPMIPAALRSAPDGVVIERSDLQLNLGREVGKRMVCDRGAALFIDYGRVAPGFGDTLQALVRHKKVDPLQTAGEADLTVHADLHGFAAMAAAAGAKVPPIISQGDFLRGLGLHERAAALIRARPARSSEIERQVERLSDAAGMGELFQVVCVCSPDVRPPGFSWSASA
jgi:SAM-dependent MidA family methyltransferase